MCCFEIVDRQSQLARELGAPVVLQKPHVLGDDPFRGRAGSAEVSELQEQALLRSRGGDANGSEACTSASARSTYLRRQGPMTETSSTVGDQISRRPDCR